MSQVFILGGAQTDFARNWARAGSDLFGEIQSTAQRALEAAQLEASAIESAHIGNFVAELFCKQGQLGGLLCSAVPEFHHLPVMRHEAACASGSMAVLAGMRDILSGAYACVMIMGIEQMRNVPGDQAADFLGAAAWQGKEGLHARYMWPHLFNELETEYARRYGLDRAYLAAIAEKNYTNAKRNPNAQTRGWTFETGAFSEHDQLNPIIEGHIRRQDCGQVSDGAACIILASEEFTHRWAQQRGMSVEHCARIAGWGHRCAPMSQAEKLRLSAHQPRLFPHVAATIQDAFTRAGISAVSQLDAIETHDCFSITEYMAIDHFGLSPPGQAWQAIENGSVFMDGACPINPSGGLIGLGHPVGATGVRMVLDAAKQVTGQAGGYQVDDAQRVACLNIGGSTTTVASFVVARN
ncbi:MAG TPA: acetyl-CoA acetyltransferase [Pseudomonadales bacterium]|nr:acetyl-CoA acetyltransferase [Pseudomonadales bacterium]